MFDTRRVRIVLPTFHPKQVEVFRVRQRNRFVALRAGRRWGKNVFGETCAIDNAIKGKITGWFAPEHKRMLESYNVIVETLDLIKKNSSKTEGVIRTITGGRIDFWSLEDEHAGRSRKYHDVIFDEAAFTKPNAVDVWERSVKPTLLDYGGTALVMSNTNGIDPANFFWRLCNERRYGFADFHAPTHSNPYLPAAELAKLQADNAPLVYQQEYLAEFVDWSGAAFFTRESLLVDGKPVEMPAHCDAVFAVVDTAVKDGKDNDGTGVTFYAYNRVTGTPLVVLDWELIQIEGALLETWLPTVFQRLEQFAKDCGARGGSLGALIEDKNSGTILIQQARRRGWPAHAIDIKLTDLGKDARAISVSGYVYRGMVKMARLAYDRTSTYKGTTRNHLLGQVVGFRVGDKAAAKRADDLLDTFTYGVAVALGDQGGF